jgi:ABC-2 type transport system permease protein
VRSAFLRQWGWELRKLWSRPRTYAGFVGALAFEITMLGLLRLPAVRDQFLQTAWRMHQRLGIREPFSALSSAVEVVGQTMTFVAVIAIVTVAADVIAREAEDGTLRMALSRPVTRGSLLAQKLFAVVSYVAALSFFVFVTTLALALLLDRPGQLVVVSPLDGVIGVHEPAAGLVRYAAALPLLAASMCTPALLAFALACFPLRAATATMVTIMVLFADWLVHTHPALGTVSPYTLTTRLASWRQVFNASVPWLRLERNYGELALLDVALLVVAWLAFRRRALR